VGRRKEFDENAVLEHAVQCFWSQGYEATSVRDLARNMGIAGASLYNAYGDKRSLYALALDYYVEHSFKERERRFEQLAPRDAIQGFLGELVERSIQDPDHKGCMLVNAALEVAPFDAEFRAVVAGVFAQIEAFLLRCVKAGQLDGTISTAHAANDMARLLLGAVIGIRVLARTRPDAELLRGLVRPLFAMLEPQRPAREFDVDALASANRA
jgi:TetR/AcrR family transcriptional regulator, transcriptional repressor for nem operon